MRSKEQVRKIKRKRANLRAILKTRGSRHSLTAQGRRWVEKVGIDHPKYICTQNAKAAHLAGGGDEGDHNDSRSSTAQTSTAREAAAHVTAKPMHAPDLKPMTAADNDVNDKPLAALLLHA
jgi:hypothetical protein